MNHGKVPLLWIGLAAIASAVVFAGQAEASSVWRGFAATQNSYLDHSDWDAAVQAEFGPNARVADWNEIKAAIGSKSEAIEFADTVLGGGSAFVYRGGNKRYSGDRHYFASSHYGSKPGYYLAHDQIEGHQISLGSWWTTKPIVAYGVSESPLSYDPPPAVTQPTPDVVEYADNSFVAGLEVDAAWTPITLGMDLSLNVPGFQPFEYHPSVSFPEDPIPFDFSYEHQFTTNDWAGASLRKIIDETGASVETGPIGAWGKLSADATIGGTLTFENNSANVDVDFEIGAGINAEVGIDTSESNMVDWPVVGPFFDTTYEKQWPLWGTPTFELGESLTMPFLFDQQLFTDVVDELNNNDNPIDDIYYEIDGNTLTMDLAGLSASLYGRTDLTINARAYLEELGDTHTNADDVINTIWSFGEKAWTIGEAINDGVEMLTSDTGTVNLDETTGIASLATGSPVWWKVLVETDGKADTLQFELAFTSDPGAMGVMGVYWEEQLIGIIDETTAGDGWTTYMLSLNEAFMAGEYELAFRIDPYSQVGTSAEIQNIAVGFTGAVPAPMAAFAMLPIFAWLANKRK